ncbi:hypothetical protein [Nocardia sp. NPDC005366]
MGRAEDDKLVVIPNGTTTFDDTAISAAVEFQETAGHYIIVRI